MCTGNTTNTHTTHRIEYMRTYGQNERWATVKLWRRARDDSTNATEWAHARWVSRTKRWMAMQTATGAPTETNNGNVFISSLSITVRVSLSGEERESARTRACECAAERESKSVSMALCFCVFSFTDNVTDNQNVCGETNGEERRERASEEMRVLHAPRPDGRPQWTDARRTRISHEALRSCCCCWMQFGLSSKSWESVLCVWEIESGEWFAALFHFAACMRRCVAWAYISASCEAELYARRVNDCKRIARGD